MAAEIWKELSDHGTDKGVQAAGLGARDTLRLEAAMPLYGHELNEQINPYQAGLGFAVNLKNRDFLGSEALTRLRDEKSRSERIGLQLDGKRVPREGYKVFDDGREVGEVTSGTFSPTLQIPIAMAYVADGSQEIGRQLEIDIRGRRQSATVCELPFYERSRTKEKVSS